jgi:hypothetical protein
MFIFNCIFTVNADESFGMFTPRNENVPAIVAWLSKAGIGHLPIKLCPFAPLHLNSHFHGKRP